LVCAPGAMLFHSIAGRGGSLMGSTWFSRSLKAMGWGGNRRCRSASTRRAKIYRLFLEQLEDRWAPALVTWTGGGNDFLWSDPHNWNPGVPVNGDDVRIPLLPGGGGPVIFDDSVPGLGVSLKSLVCDEPFVMTQPLATYSTTLTLSGPGPFRFND